MGENEAGLVALHLERARALLTQQYYPEAVAAAEAALDAAPPDAAALYWSGCALGWAGAPERAEERLTACLGADPGFPGARVQRAYARLRSGDELGARADLLAARDLDGRASAVLLAVLVRDPGPGPETAAALDAGWAHLRSGEARDDAALRGLLAAVTVGHSQALIDDGDLRGALAALGRCAADPPADPPLREQLTRLCLRAAADGLDRVPAGREGLRDVENAARHARALRPSGPALHAGVTALDTHVATGAAEVGSCPGTGTAALVAAGRRAEAVRLLTEAFAAEPATSTAHQLALATLWPVVHRAVGSGHDPLGRTVAMWAVVLADESYCAAFGSNAAARYGTEVPAETVRAAVARLEAWMTSTLAAARGSRAEVLFTRELLAARELGAAGGFRPPGGGALACGPLLLGITGHVADFGRFAAGRWGAGSRATHLFSQLGQALIDAESGRVQRAVEHLRDLRCDRCRRGVKGGRSAGPLPLACREGCSEFVAANPGYAGLAEPRQDFLTDAAVLAIRFRLDRAAAAIAAEVMDLPTATKLWREALRIARSTDGESQVRQHVTTQVLGRARYLRSRRQQDAIALLDAFPLDELAPSGEDVRHRVAVTHSELLNAAGVELAERKQPDYAGAAVALRRAVRLNRSSQVALRNLLEVLHALALAASDRHDFSASRALLEEAVDAAGRVPADEPVMPEVRRKRETLLDNLLDVRCDELMGMVRRGHDVAATKAYHETRRSLPEHRRPVLDETWAGMLVTEAVGLVDRDDARAITYLELAGRLAPQQKPDIEKIIAATRQKRAVEVNNRALELHQRGRYSEAIALFDEAVALTPDDSVLAQNRALVVLEKALLALRNMLEPADPFDALGLAPGLLRGIDVDLARDLLRGIPDSATSRELLTSAEELESSLRAFDAASAGSGGPAPANVHDAVADLLVAACDRVARAGYEERRMVPLLRTAHRTTSNPVVRTRAEDVARRIGTVEEVTRHERTHRRGPGVRLPSPGRAPERGSGPSEPRPIPPRPDPTRPDSTRLDPLRPARPAADVRHPVIAAVFLCFYLPFVLYLAVAVARVPVVIGLLAFLATTPVALHRARPYVAALLPLSTSAPATYAVGSGVLALGSLAFLFFGIPGVGFAGTGDIVLSALILVLGGIAVLAVVAVAEQNQRWR